MRRRPGVDRRGVREEAPREDGHGHVDASEGVVVVVVVVDPVLAADAQLPPRVLAARQHGTVREEEVDGRLGRRHGGDGHALVREGEVAVHDRVVEVIDHGREQGRECPVSPVAEAELSPVIRARGIHAARGRQEVG